MRKEFFDTPTTTSYSAWLRMYAYRGSLAAIIALMSVALVLLVVAFPSFALVIAAALAASYLAAVYLFKLSFDMNFSGDES